MEYIYETKGTCSKIIKFNLDKNIVTSVRFLGGCPGNLKALSKLVEGMTVDEINEKLCGITCGSKETSCADQLSKAVTEAYENSKSTV